MPGGLCACRGAEVLLLPEAELTAKTWASLSSLNVPAAMLAVEDREGEGEPRINHDQRS
jgi:hypothetical protein